MKEQRSVAGLITMFLEEGEEVLSTAAAATAIDKAMAESKRTKFLGDYIAHQLQPFLTSIQAYPVCAAEDHVTIDQAPEVPQVHVRATFGGIGQDALESYEL
jgi:hypothetical protein